MAGRGYVAVIVGTIGARRYVVAIDVDENDPAYMKPGTELQVGYLNPAGGIEVCEVGGQNRRWTPVKNSGVQDTVIVLHADRNSGTLDAWMITSGQSH